MDTHTETKTYVLSDSEVLERVRKDIIVLLYRQAFFAYLLTKMKKIIDDRVPVAGVSVVEGVITLHINPEGYLSYTREERIFILIHEVMHVIFYHHIRKKKRNHKLWNVATDIAINQLIESAYAHMPVDCLKVDSWKEKNGFVLPKKLNAESYYKILWERKEKLDIPDDLLQGALGQHLEEQMKKKKKKNQKKENKNQISGVVSDIDHIKRTLVVNETSYTISENAVLTTDENDDISMEDLDKGMTVVLQVREDDKEIADLVMVKLHKQMTKEENEEENDNNDNQQEGDDSSPFDDLHPTWEDSTDTSEQLAESIIRSAIQEAYKQANGSIPGNLRETIKEILEPKVNWKAILRNFIAKRRNTSKKATWKKRNRRLGNNVMGYKKNRHLTVVVAIDTSASITKDDFALFHSEIMNIHQSGASIVLIECDAKIHSIAKFNKKTTPTFTGRGGTDFRPVFEAINKREEKLLLEKPDAVLFLTDGMGPAPEFFGIPTLWCLIKGGKKPYVRETGSDVSWGTAIKMEN